jgi:hypothetical protein
MQAQKIRSALVGVGVATLLTLPLTAAHQPSEATEASGVSVVAINRNWADLRIYVVAEASQQRLGVVRSFNTVAFEIPKVMLSPRYEIRLAAEAIGSSDRYLSQSILVTPGETIEWHLENQLVHSSVHVRHD